MGMAQEFKEFAMKGNVIDLAVGVVIGGAFGKIVNSLVEDIINPLVGMLTGGIDLANQYLVLSNPKNATFASLAEARKAGAVVLGYGNLLNNALQFLIVAFAIFLVIKQVNRFTRLEGDNLPKPKPAA
jgi:large conductance mechanosensitive channel